MLAEHAEANRHWRPLCTGGLADAANDVILEIARELRAVELADGSVTGQGAVALFHAWLAQTFPERGFLELARRHLERAVETLARGESKHWLFGGFTGLGWTLEAIRRAVPDLVEDETVNHDVDEALLSILQASPWPADYDLSSGLVGIGVYALEGLPRPAARACLELVIARLAELATRSADGVTWWSDARCGYGEAAKYPYGCHNLGMAHGVPGVIALLAQVCTHAEMAPMARPLVEGAARWLLRQRRSDGRARWFGRTAEDPRPARTAWCYGEPGIAVALLAAARVTGDATLEQAAIEVGLTAAGRCVDESGVIDAGLCHGAAGLAHVYNRLFQATGMRRLAFAATTWIERTIALWRRDRADAGLLTGAAGIGLALLAATTTVEPSWDRVLLCAIPARQ